MSNFIVNNRLGHLCPDPRLGCRLINTQAAEGNTAYSAVRTPPNDGSLRIADIICQHIDDSTARTNSLGA